MAADPSSLDLNLANATHQDMLSMVEEERDLRRALLQRVRHFFPQKIFVFIFFNQKSVYLNRFFCHLHLDCQPSTDFPPPLLVGSLCISTSLFIYMYLCAFLFFVHQYVGFKHLFVLLPSCSLFIFQPLFP